MTTATATQSPAPPSLAAVKAKQQAMWASGDFSIVGTTLQVVGERLCEAADLRATDRVLDVAAGNGNATLAAARHFAEVVSTDYVPALLERGRRRAEAEGLDVEFRTADAEALPFETHQFDLVLSTFGVMFAPDHEAAAREMARVCRPGGRIALAAWTPEGFIGEMFRVTARHVPPPAGVRPAVLWGTRAHLEALFGAHARQIEHRGRTFGFRYKSAEHFVDVFRRYYGPTHKAFAALDEAGQRAYEQDLLQLLRASDKGDDRGLVVPAEYLESVITLP